MSNFSKMSSQWLVKIKKDVKLFELQQDIQPSFGEGENLDSNQITEDGMSHLLESDGGDLSTQENQSPIHKEIQPMSEVRPQSPVPKYVC